MSDLNQQMRRDIVLIDELLSGNTENGCVEFKHNNASPEMIGKLCSALSNVARIQEKDFAYVLWGVEDGTQKIVGTTFNPETQTKGNQVLAMWLSQMLTPRITFSFRQVNHPDGKLVLLEIPATHTTPVEFERTAYLRIGSATPRLSDYPEHYQKLINSLRSYNWEKAVAKSFVTADEVVKLIDYPSYFKLTKQNLPENRSGILERLAADAIINKDVGGHWNITNLGAILFAENLEDFGSAHSRKGIRFVAYDGDNRASTVKQRIDGKKGYANAFSGIVSYINNLLPVNEHIGSTQRNQQLLFPEIAIRETIANALIHQDMTISGTGPLVELFDTRLEITNPGKSLVQTDRMIDLPPRSRNEALASLMRRMGMCEEQGTGLDKVIMSVEVNQLPPPKFQEMDHSMRVILFAPRTFADMTVSERTRACYQHSIMKYLEGAKMKNSTLCERFGIEKHNAAQASAVIKKALDNKLIKAADPEHPRGGYEPIWA
ncbi:putative transcriptional regulator with HTH domain [Owenweeksia hongkongensis DSM 17368]|uniref:Putative transcriptional regulator with HTH domain n=1 Tax=Owenweeksia hongkongensis (strain DSM 17368 / CIP 108786 / JCM 12287 / NRRL B-23963 / UST20020801) TaxID=926562 RepID=G8R4C3_OWEHD|nr:ATP-binding protein [Owenweeksia hongkongensis]AEV34223.1 putative transcriptional regulator with HTH domain [Owenweeksia hongkongensis DSM 17368]